MTLKISELGEFLVDLIPDFLEVLFMKPKFLIWILIFIIICFIIYKISSKI